MVTNVMPTLFEFFVLGVLVYQANQIPKTSHRTPILACLGPGRGARLPFFGYTIRARTQQSTPSIQRARNRCLNHGRSSGLIIWPRIRARNARGMATFSMLEDIVGHFDDMLFAHPSARMPNAPTSFPNFTKSVGTVKFSLDRSKVTW